MSQRQNVKYTILDGAAANGAGNKILTTDFRYCIVTVDTSADADMTIKFQGSAADPGDNPDFESNQSNTNQWSFVQLKNHENGDAVTGSTGIVKAGADPAIHNTYEVDVNGLDYITAQIYSYVAGDATVRISLYTE